MAAAVAVAPVPFKDEDDDSSDDDFADELEAQLSAAKEAVALAEEALSEAEQTVLDIQTSHKKDIAKEKAMQHVSDVFDPEQHAEKMAELDKLVDDAAYAVDQAQKVVDDLKDIQTKTYSVPTILVSRRVRLIWSPTRLQYTKSSIVMQAVAWARRRVTLNLRTEVESRESSAVGSYGQTGRLRFIPVAILIFFIICQLGLRQRSRFVSGISLQVSLQRNSAR